MRSALSIKLNKTQTEQLENMARSLTLPARFVRRAHMILLTADGHSQRDIGQYLGCNFKTVRQWQQRWIAGGCTGLMTGRHGRGRKAWVLPKVGPEVIRKTLEETPEHASEWTTRSMANAMGVAAATVSKIWKMHGLDPHDLASYTYCPPVQLDEVFTPDRALNPDDHSLVEECKMPPAEGAATESIDGFSGIDPLAPA